MGLKKLARQIFEETLAAIDIPSAMQRKIVCDGSRLVVGGRSFELMDFDKFRIVAMGKAAHAIVDGLLGVLPTRSSYEGIVAAPTAPKVARAGLKYFVSGHPVPNQASLDAADAILEMLAICHEKTVVFFLLTGGGSSLVEKLLDPEMSLEEIQELNRLLVTAGADIDSINTIRKHLSAVKGGRLTLAAGAATKISLAVTDVPEGKDSALCSGPTLPDPKTLGDFSKAVEDWKLWEKFPPRLHRWMEKGRMPETPKGGELPFRNAHYFLLMGKDELFHPAHHAAEARGFVACCDNATDDWPVEKAVEYLLGQLEELKNIHPGERVALIADGEVSSPVTGNGVGGRNSAFVLKCVERIAGNKIAVLSAGTDGVDGNSPAAGAVADGETLARARVAGIDVDDSFHRSDAFNFFYKLGDAIVTGPTGNNLRDFRILMAEPDG
jgi:glycerate 2-kinase